MTQSNIEKQMKLAAYEEHLYETILIPKLTAHPNVKVTRIHDSWNFEGPRDEVLEIVKGVNKEVNDKLANLREG